MAGRIRIPPYKPLGIATQAVPGGGYFDIDASAGQFGASPCCSSACRARRVPPASSAPSPRISPATSKPR